MVGTSNFGSWNGHWSWGKFCSPWAHWILPQYVSSGTLAQLWKPWPILVDLAYFPVPYLKLPNAKSHYIPWDVYIYIYIHVCIYIYTCMYISIYPHDIPMIFPLSRKTHGPNGPVFSYWRHVPRDERRRISRRRRRKTPSYPKTSSRSVPQQWVVTMTRNMI